MKSIFKTLILALGAIALLAGSVSCEKHDYPDRFRATEGLPTIHYVKKADADVFVTQAYMSDALCIVGDNLKSVHNLFFNDQEAVLNNAFITDHTLLVQVPATQAVAKTDKIYFYNKAGESTSFDFKVLPPAPKVVSMSCEWAGEGDAAYLTGKYFMDVTSVSINGTEISGYKVTSSERIDFTVPAGLTAGPITVVTESGSYTTPFWYKDNRGMLFTFEPGSLMPNGWNIATIKSDATDGICGGYIQFGDGSTTLAADGSAWAEGEGGFSMPYWPGSWNDPEDYSSAVKLTDIVDFSNYANMAYKFEMLIPAENPWKSNALQVIPAPVTAVSMGNACTDIYGVSVAGQNNTYFHELGLPRGYYAPFVNGGSFDTGGKWITVTLPIAEFLYDWEGTPSTAPLNADSFASLIIFFHGTAGAECAPIIKVDNIRVVPN